MALSYRIVGRRPLADGRTAVDVEWSHPDGRVLRADGAKAIPDQVNLPREEAADEAVARVLEAKRADLERALGVG